MSAKSTPFEVRDCALVTLATGRVAHDLRELRQELSEAPASVLRHHFLESLLRPTFDDPEYRNEFSLWAHQALYEEALAERISALDPFVLEADSTLRKALLDLLDSRLDGATDLRAAAPGHAFHLLRSQLVVFSTGLSADDPAGLARLAPRITPSSVYFHFVEAQLRPPHGEDDFSAWLAAWPGSSPARARLAAIDPQLGSLDELRERVVEALSRLTGGPA